MRKLQNAQRGFSFYSLSLYMGLLAFVVFTVLQLLPAYEESFSVESSVRSLESDRGVSYSGARAVKSALRKKLGFNNVEAVTSDDIGVVRQDNVYEVNVNYEFRIPYFKNIELVISFSHSAEVPAS